MNQEVIQNQNPKRKRIETYRGEMKITKRTVNGVEIDEETFFNTVWTNEKLAYILSH